MPISRYAANYAIVLGLYWIVVFVLRIATMKFASVSFFYVAMLLGSFYLAFRLGKRFLEASAESGKNTSYLDFWMFGVMLFFYASLLDGMIQYIYYQFINPNYISQQLALGLQALKSLSEDSKMIEAYEQIGVQTPIKIVMQMAWNSTLVGGIYFAVVGLFVVGKRTQKVSNNE